MRDGQAEVREWYASQELASELERAGCPADRARRVLYNIILYYINII